MAERAVAALTGLRCETKLHSGEADSQAQRCGRAGEVLSREGIHERGRHLQRQGKQTPELGLGE
jgi:hypothetical protein